MTQEDTLTIALSGRPPVRIVKTEWPIIASAKTWDNALEVQADRIWTLTVRRHADGRAIVYGIFRSAYQNEPDRRGGELLPPDQDIATAIYHIADALEFPRPLADECIANLPAEPL